VAAISDLFLLRANDPTWWAAHLLWEEWDIDDPVALEMALPGAVLRLAVCSYSSELSLVVDGVEHELGWDDEGHWHPHVFRWPEVAAICRYVAARPPWDKHPMLPLALLHRFAVAADDRSVEAMRAAVEPVLAALGLSDDHVARALSHCDLRPGRRREGWDVLVGPGWVPDEVVGWRLDLWWQRDYEAAGEAADPAPYSLRYAENIRFPAKELRRVLDRLT
jgi:hypothetical protein